METPWTDSAIDQLKSDAFKVHPSTWAELRRIEEDGKRYRELLRMVCPLTLTIGPNPETLADWLKNPDRYRDAITAEIDRRINQRSDDCQQQAGYRDQIPTPQAAGGLMRESAKWR